MKVEIERLTHPNNILEAMRVTSNADMTRNKNIRLGTMFKMAVAEHSCIRALKYRIRLYGIPYYIHTHLVRHTVAVEPYVQSQRDDNGKKESGRDKRTQDELVNMVIDVNLQSLLNMAKKRLCHRAHATVREIFKRIAYELKQGDKYDTLAGKLLMPHCKWYGSVCPEPETCGKVKGVITMEYIHERVLK